MSTQIIRDNNNEIVVGRFCKFNRVTGENAYSIKPINNQKLHSNGTLTVKSAIFDYLLINGEMSTVQSSQDQSEGIKVSKLAVHGTANFTNKELDIDDFYSTGGITLINCRGRIKNLQCSGSIYIDETSNLQIDNLYNAGGGEISGTSKILNVVSNSLTLSGNSRVENIQSSSNLEVTESAFVKNVNIHSGGFMWNSDYISETATFIMQNGGGEYSGNMPDVDIFLNNFALTFTNSKVKSLKSKGEVGLTFVGNNEIDEINSESPIVIIDNSTNNLKSGKVSNLEIVEDDYPSEPFNQGSIEINENYTVGEIPNVNYIGVDSIIVDYETEKEFFNN